MGLHLRKTRVKFERPTFPVDAIGRTIADGLRGMPPLPRGASVAVAAGSRGIANIQRITRAVVDGLRKIGHKPFLVPAMGSHGGATGAGQIEILSTFGITESAMGCEIRSSMEVVALDNSGLEHPLYMDAHAASADAVVLLNRIKPHTDFHGPYESGLCKMAVIGLGKQKQAEVMHSRGVRGLRDLMPLAAKHLLERARIWAGVAIVENAYDETAAIHVIPAREIYTREPELLDVARRNMPRLPVDKLDVLLVRQLGKNFSGTGLDSGIIGRMRIPGEPEPDRPSITSLAILDMSDESHGNAIGVGYADVITERLFQKIDRAVTLMNVGTACFVERGKIPLALPTDEATYALALKIAFGTKPDTARVMVIPNTLHLDEVYVSAAVERELAGRADIEFVGDAQPAFDAAGNLRHW